MADSITEERQREELKEILCDLANDQSLMRDPKERSEFYVRLERLYYSPVKEKRFRHFYSDIFAILSSIRNGDIEGNTDIVGQNLKMIKDGYKPINKDENGNNKDISNEIRKLYDHVSLEIARLNYCVSVVKSETQENEINSLKGSAYELKEKVSNTQKEIENAQKKTDSMQKEYIAILGIFASVVLAFIGGIVFSTSVFSNIHLASIYRISLITLIVGLVVVNIIYALFAFISNMTNKKEKVFSIKPVIIFNAIFLIMIAAVIVCWWIGVVELRDKCFK